MEAYQKHRFDREIDRAFETNADQTAPRTIETVMEVINKIPTLKRFYDKYVQKHSLQINYSGEHPRINAKAEFYLDTGNSNINYYNMAFDSYYKLAHVTLHEFGHLNSASIGAYVCNKLNFGEYIATAMDEIYAYKFGNFHGGTSMDTDQYRANVKILASKNINAETLALPSFEF